MRFKDVINPVKWVSFIHGKIMKLFLKQHLIEQYALRIIECNDCVVSGKCHDCGCEMPAKAWVPWETCSQGKWGAIMSKSEWNSYKKRYSVKFKITFKDEQ